MSEIFKVFLSNAAMFISVYGFGVIIFDYKINKRNIVKNLLISLGIICLYTVVFLKFNGTMKTVLFCMDFMLTYKLVFNRNFGNSLISAIIYLVILIVPDLLTLLGALYILGIEKEYYYNVLAGGIICNLSVSILMIIITYIIKKPLKKIININISSSKKILLIGILTLSSIGFFFYSLISTFEFSNNIIIYIIVITTLITIFFNLFKQKIENDNILKRYDELLDIMKNYEDDIEEQRTLIHETRNELTTIRCKIKDKETENEIIEYIDSIMGDKVNSKMSKYSKFKYLPSNGLKGFFYYKVSEAERKGINVSVNISKQIENSIIGRLDTKHFKDLARVIGVYLDNAIEASSLSEEKKLGIEIYLIKNNVEIIVSNTYQGTIDENKIGKERYSTKGKNRGHGLLLVKRILSENKRIISSNKITDELYIQKISIINSEE